MKWDLRSLEIILLVGNACLIFAVSIAGAYIHDLKSNLKEIARELRLLRAQKSNTDDVNIKRNNQE